MKLYEKGHRSLDDLRNDGSLTNAQKLGLKYFDDIRQRIPRHEVCNTSIKEIIFLLTPLSPTQNLFCLNLDNLFYLIGSGDGSHFT